MTLSLMTFVPAVAVAVLCLVVLSFKLYSEAMKFTDELQFFLKHRTISDNQNRAKLAVFKTKYEQLEKENQLLKMKINQLTVEMTAFEDEKTIEAQKMAEQKIKEIDELEMEITSIQKTLNSDIKQQLANYLKEVDGLSQRIHRAKKEIIQDRVG